MTKPIIIKGKAAKRIYDEIISKEHGVYIKNMGDETNPVLAVCAWE